MKSNLGFDPCVRPHRHETTDLTLVVCVIDDDAAVRDALRDLFESVGLRVNLFESTREFLRTERPNVPCCLVLDVRLPGQSGLDFQRELNERNIALPIIFLTGHGDIPMSVRAMKAGAVEFLTKPFREQDLLDAVQAALARDRSTRADEELLTELRQRCDALTPRERTVMRLVVSGWRNKQIAGEIQTCEATVKVHRTNLMRKMQASSLADLIVMVGRLGSSDKSSNAPTEAKAL
jgi:FixJ family two-component response regulator